MQNIINLIKNNTNKSSIYSIFASNGTGKTVLCEKLNGIFCQENYENIKEDYLTKNFSAKSSGFRMVFKVPKGTTNIDDALFINEYTASNKNILLPKYLINFLEEKSFSFNLKYSNIIFTTSNLTYPNNLFRSLYLFFEKKLPNFSIITFPSQFITKSIYFFNSTDIQTKEGYIDGTRKIETLSLIIEYICSLIEISVMFFLELLKTKNLLQIETYVEKKIKKLYLITDDEKTSFKHKYGFVYELTVFVSSLLKTCLCLVQNKHLICFLSAFNNYNNKNIKKQINEINNYNLILIKYFPKAKEIFNKFFPNKFYNLELNKRFNASLNMFIYDIRITNFIGQTFSTFNFNSNIGSEGEKKLINMLHLIITIISLDDNKQYFITADDAFDSFDNANYSNIFKMLEYLLKNKSYKFINFTHNYEQFRDFNERLKLNRDNIYLMKRESLTIITEDSFEQFKFINFPILKDFYNDYLKSKKHKHTEDEIVTLLATIPHFRNIVELTEGLSSLKYILATNLLHKKDNNSNNLVLLLNEYIINKNSFNEKNVKDYCLTNPNYYNMLFKIFNKIINDVQINVDLLEYKIFISIFGRLTIENFIIDFLNLNLIKNPISKNQTGFLINKFEQKLKLYSNNDLNLIKKDIEYLNTYIPDYFHTNYNEISYLINLDINNLILGTTNLLDKIKRYESTSFDFQI